MRNVLALANGKGGVGKTTLAANIAGLAAASGWDVLAVDLDHQGNLGADLGYRNTDTDDGGLALQAALAGRRPLAPSGRDVRPGLDVVAGGQHSEALGRLEGGQRLAEVLRPVARDYDLIVLDCPPTDKAVGVQALVAAGGLVVPVRPDAASLQGLQVTADQYRAARRHNPQLRLLGVVLFGVGRSATAIRAELRAALEDILDGVAPVFEAAVSYAERAAWDMRMSGQLAHEYEATADDARRRRLAMLRNGTDLRQLPRTSQAAEGLADDFAAVANEILARLVETDVEANS